MCVQMGARPHFYCAWGCFRYFWLGARSATSYQLSSDQLPRRLALEPGVDAFDHLAIVVAKTVLGDVAEMRRQHEVVELAERVVDRQRLDREHIDAGARDLLVRQRFQKCCF